MKANKNFNRRYLVISTILITQILATSVQAQGLTPASAATPQPAPQQVAKKTLNLQEMEMKASRAAEAFAIDVLEIIGRGHQVRYNIREGLLSGLRQIGDYTNSTVVMNSSDYLNALSSGSAEGRSRGLEAGAYHAQLISNSMAQADINAAVDVAIDTGKKIVFNPQPRSAPFAGVESNLAAPMSFDSRIIGSNSALQSEARRMLDSRYPYSLINEVFNMREIQQEHDTAIPEMFRGDSAFENWRRNTLQSTASVYSDAKNYYAEITNASIYENTDANGRAFRNALIMGYSRAIERNWNSKVKQSSSSAISFGRDLYLEQAENYAKELGRFHGYNAEHKRASVEEFGRQMSKGDYYKNAFASIRHQVETNAYIGSEVVRIQSEEGLSELTLGDTIDIFVDSLTNRGMKKGLVKVTPLAAEQVTVMGQGGAIEVNGLTRLKADERFQRQMWISDITSPDKVITVSAQVGDKVISTQVKLTFEAMIRRIASGRDAATAQILVKKAAEYMKAQYDDMSGFKDQYKDRKPDRLLVRMLNVFQTLSEGDKATLRTYGQTIRDAFGGKPTKFLNPKRNEWDAVQAMINEMGLAGSVPDKANSQNNNTTDPWANNNHGG